MQHGTRPDYQKGCRCTPCRAAEAAYRHQLRAKHLKGLPVLGQLVSASEAWARIRILKQEGFVPAQITGWRDPRHLPLRSFTPGQRVRLSTLLRLRRLCQLYLIQDEDLPNHHPVDDSRT